MLACLLPRLARFRQELLMKPELGQRILIAASHKDNIPAVPPVAAIRSAPIDKFLMPKTNSPVAAIPSLDIHLNLINKHTPLEYRAESQPSRR